MGTGQRGTDPSSRVAQEPRAKLEPGNSRRRQWRPCRSWPQKAPWSCRWGRGRDTAGMARPVLALRSLARRTEQARPSMGLGKRRPCSGRLFSIQCVLSVQLMKKSDKHTHTYIETFIYSLYFYFMLII